jgi:hypothetical protein
LSRGNDWWLRGRQLLPFAVPAKGREHQMINKSVTSRHPGNRWQFWALLVCVFLTIVSPSVSGSASDWEIGAINAAVAGLLLLGLALLDVDRHSHWTDIYQIALGLWLCVSPYILDYQSANLVHRHLAIGAILVVLAAFSLLWESLCTLLRDSRR